MDINETLENMIDLAQEYCNENYNGQPIDAIFTMTLARSAMADTKDMDMFHNLCFRFILQQTLEKFAINAADQAEEIKLLKSEMEKMANVIDIMNQDSTGK